MFQFTGFPSIRYGLAYGWQRFALPGFPIRKSPDHRIFAPSRSFSQLIASFIGSQCQGIHPALLMLDLYLVRCHSSVNGRLCVLCFKSICLSSVSSETESSGFDNITCSHIWCLGCLFLSLTFLRLDIDLYMRFSRYIFFWLISSVIRKQKLSFYSLITG